MSDNQDQSPAAALFESIGFKQFAKSVREFTQSLGFSDRECRVATGLAAAALATAGTLLEIVGVPLVFTGEPGQAMEAVVAGAGLQFLGGVAKLVEAIYCDDPEQSSVAPPQRSSRIINGYSQ